MLLSHPTQSSMLSLLTRVTKTGQSLQPAPLMQPSQAGLHQSLHSDIDVVSLVRNPPYLLSRWLASCSSLFALSAIAPLTFQFCKDLGIVVSWEKSDPEPKTQAQYWGDAERGYMDQTLGSPYSRM